MDAACATDPLPELNSGNKAKSSTNPTSAEKKLRRAKTIELLPLSKRMSANNNSQQSRLCPRDKQVGAPTSAE